MTLDTPPGDIGPTLRGARERRQLTLRQVSDSTKVPVDILQAIERNDVSRVPGGLYVRGYVRSFAAAVGLDPEPTVAAFVAQFPSGSVSIGYPAAERPPVAALDQPPAPEVPARRRRREGFTLLRFTAVSAVSAAVGVYMGMAIGQAGQERSEATAVSTAGPAIAGEGRQVGEVVAPPVPLPVPEPRLAVDAPPAVPVNAVETDAAPPAPLAPEAPAEIRPPLTSPLAVVVAAKSPSWVILTVDGRKTVNRLFQVGERETLEARRDLVLTAGDAGAIVMTLNGRLARSIGRPGETVTARVDGANFRDYLRQ